MLCSAMLINCTPPSFQVWSLSTKPVRAKKPIIGTTSACASNARIGLLNMDSTKIIAAREVRIVLIVRTVPAALCGGLMSADEG